MGKVIGDIVKTVAPIAGGIIGGPLGSIVGNIAGDAIGGMMGGSKAGGAGGGLMDIVGKFADVAKNLVGMAGKFAGPFMPQPCPFGPGAFGPFPGVVQNPLGPLQGLGGLMQGLQDLLKKLTAGGQQGGAGGTGGVGTGGGIFGPGADPIANSPLLKDVGGGQTQLGASMKSAEALMASDDPGKQIQGQQQMQKLLRQIELLSKMIEMQSQAQSKIIAAIR